MAIQIGRAAGARVVATARTEANVATVRTEGASAVVGEDAAALAWRATHGEGTVADMVDHVRNLVEG